MPLFQITNTSLTAVEQQNFDSEKRLQHLIEANLRTVFSCRLVASEFSTGALHAGRIDTLALSEDDNPVIIEYKKAESSELINQGLFYLHWLQDHRGDFEVAGRKAIRNGDLHAGLHEYAFHHLKRSGNPNPGPTPVPAPAKTS